MLATIATLESARARELLPNAQERIIRHETTALAEKICAQCRIAPSEQIAKRLIDAALPLLSDDEAANTAFWRFTGMEGLLTAPGGTTATERLARFRQRPPHSAESQTAVSLKALPTLTEWLQRDLLAGTESRCAVLFRQYRDAANAVEVIPGVSPASRQALLRECQDVVVSQARSLLHSSLQRLHSALACRPQCLEFLVEWVEGVSTIVGLTSQVHDAVTSVLSSVAKICPQANSLPTEGATESLQAAVFSQASQLAAEVSELVDTLSTAVPVSGEDGSVRVTRLLTCGLTLVVVIPATPTQDSTARPQPNARDTTADMTQMRWKSLSTVHPTPSLLERLGAFRSKHYGTTVSPTAGLAEAVGVSPHVVHLEFGDDPDDKTESATEKCPPAPSPPSPPSSPHAEPPVVSRAEKRECETYEEQRMFPFLESSPVHGVYLEDLELTDDPRMRPQLNRLRMERMTFGADSDAVRKQQAEVIHLVREIAEGKQRDAVDARRRFPFLPFRVEGVLISNLVPLLDDDDQFDELMRVYTRLPPEHRGEIKSEALRLAHALALRCPYCVDEAKSATSVQLLSEIEQSRTAKESPGQPTQKCSEGHELPMREEPAQSPTEPLPQTAELSPRMEEPVQLQKPPQAERTTAKEQLALLDDEVAAAEKSPQTEQTLHLHSADELVPTEIPAPAEPPAQVVTLAPAGELDVGQSTQCTTPRVRPENARASLTPRPPTPTKLQSAINEMLSRRTRNADSHPQTPTPVAFCKECENTPRASSNPALPPVAPRRLTDERQQATQRHQPVRLGMLEPIAAFQQAKAQPSPVAQATPPLLRPLYPAVPRSQPTADPAAGRHPSYLLAPLPSLSSSDLHDGGSANPPLAQSTLPPPKVAVCESDDFVKQRPFTAQPSALLAKRTARRKSSGASTTMNAVSPRRRLDFTREDSLRHVYTEACRELGLKPNSALVMSLPSEAGLFVSTLDLSTNYVGAKGLLPLLYVLEHNEDHLRRLSLRNNRLENGEVAQLTKVLLGKCGSHLTSLDLSHNMISQHGGKCLLHLCRSQPTIRSVQVDGTFLPPAFSDSLKRALTDVKRA